MAKLFDTHAHYTDESFLGKEELIRDIFAGDVGHIITVAVDAADSEKCVNLASQYENMFASVGIHPSEITEISDIPAEVAKLERHIAHNKCVALGEMGLDYHWAKAYAEEQKKLFERQMELAVETGLPVIIHDREAHGDTFDIIKRYEGKVSGVMHCYSGHAELAREYVKMGWYVSFTGVITYKNAQKNVESAQAVPLDRLLIETDCPYLTPVPMRKKKNHSGFLHYTAEFTAGALGVDYETFVETTTANAKKLFSIK
ncbi:MAG: TatD family hydrolase [Clostridia bacterium]|nr:TatD family hydrolase [Clostridia bacterium]